MGYCSTSLTANKSNVFYLGTADHAHLLLHSELRTFFHVRPAARYPHRKRPCMTGVLFALNVSFVVVIRFEIHLALRTFNNDETFEHDWLLNCFWSGGTPQKQKHPFVWNMRQHETVKQTKKKGWCTQRLSFEWRTANIHFVVNRRDTHTQIGDAR